MVNRTKQQSTTLARLHILDKYVTQAGLSLRLMLFINKKKSNFSSFISAPYSTTNEYFVLVFFIWLNPIMMCTLLFLIITAILSFN